MERGEQRSFGRNLEEAERLLLEKLQQTDPDTSSDGGLFLGYSPRQQVLEVLISSKTRIKVLELLFFDPDTGIHVREIARQTEQETNAVRRELAKLEEAEFITSTTKGNRRFYQVNQQYPGYPILKSLFTVSQEELIAMGSFDLESEERGIPEITLGRRRRQLKINSEPLRLTIVEYALVEHLDNYRGDRFAPKVLARVAQAEGYNGDPAGILQRIEGRTVVKIFEQTVEGEETLWSLPATEKLDNLQRAVPPSRLSTLNLMLDDPNATPSDIMKELGRMRDGNPHMKQHARRALMNTVWRLLAFREPNSRFGRVTLTPEEIGTIDRARAFMQENQMDMQAWGKFSSWVLSRLEMKRGEGNIEPLSDEEAAVLGSMLFLRAELLDYYGVERLPTETAMRFTELHEQMDLFNEKLGIVINRALRKVRALMDSDRLDEIFDMHDEDTQTLLTYFVLVELGDRFEFFKDILSWNREANFKETDPEHEARNRMLLQRAPS